MSVVNYLTIFNDQFMEFIEDIVRLFPDRTGLKTTKQVFETARKMNPKIIMEMLNMYLLKKYENEIMSDNFDFFVNKDYTDEVYTIPKSDGIKANNEQILREIEKIREPLNELSNENKEKILQYFKNLIQLTTLYEESKKR
jgi:hypothetical protein